MGKRLDPPQPLPLLDAVPAGHPLGQQPRFVRVDSDNMAPTLRIGDLAAVAPIDGFEYDSIYVLEVCGHPCLYRCQRLGDGTIRVSSDNPAYAVQIVDRAAFDDWVIGIVAATCRVLDRGRMGVA